MFKRGIIVLVMLFICFSFVSAEKFGYNYLNPGDNLNPATNISTTILTGNLTNFTELSDTPASYAGESGNCVSVNGGATGLEFTTCGNDNSTWSEARALTLFAAFEWGYNQTINAIQPYLYTDGLNLYFNETFLNITIDDRVGGVGGNASWNESYANDLYVNEDGDTMTGNLTMENNSIIFTDGEYITANNFDDLKIYSDDDIQIIPGGEVTVDGDINPATNLARDLGSAIIMWDNIFAGDLILSYNASAGWFNGKFNWIINPSSTGYLSFNGTTLDFNETFLNDTIDARASSGGNLSFNETLTNTLYADIKWGYNQTTAGQDNASWNEARADTLYAGIGTVAGNGSSMWETDGTKLYNETVNNMSLGTSDAVIEINNKGEFTFWGG